MLAARLANTLPRFNDDEKGSTAIIFGLSSMMLLFVAGMGVDMSRITHAKHRVTAAADAAALTAGKAMLEGKLNDAEVKAMGLSMFDTNLKTFGGGYANVKNVKIQINRVTGEVSVDVDASVDMTLTKLAGFTTVKLPAGTAATFGMRDIEVGMALDVTGSMNSVPSGGGSRKIEGLKAAFDKFAHMLIPDQPVAGQKVRIGVAPYSAAVNLGSFAGTVTNGRSVDGCVTERSTSARYADASLTSGGYYDVMADGVADIDGTEGVYANSYFCPSPVVTPLTDNRDALIQQVNAFVPNGWTAGHLGVQWAWNLISEDWGSVWSGSSRPAPYADVGSKRLIKAVVLMTDGIFNTAYHNDKASVQAIAMCDNMKARGVQVFAVAFDAPVDAQATLKACATPGTDFYANASNAAELDAAFAKFAGKLGELRLSK